MIETFAKSQENILNSADFKISAERFLKSRKTVYGPLLKKNLKTICRLVERKLATRSSLSFMIPWKPNSILPLTRRSLIRQSKLKQQLQEVKKLLAERHKLIKIADRSECGWATVSAYVTDDLAYTQDNINPPGKLWRQRERNRGRDIRVSNPIILFQQ